MARPAICPKCGAIIYQALDVFYSCGECAVFIHPKRLTFLDYPSEKGEFNEKPAPAPAPQKEVK